jgi:hypothetical protein
VQPPIEYFASDFELPPLQRTSEPGNDLLCFLFKRYKYVTFAFRKRRGGEVEAFTIHQADAQSLLKALSTALEDSSDLSFRTRLLGGSEGFSRGGPPQREDLIEFAPEEKRQAIIESNAERLRNLRLADAEAPERKKRWWEFW